MTLSVQLIQIPSAETVPKREFYINSSTIKIGRDYSADICLPDISEKMSRVHLMVFRLDNGGYTVTDTSTNGAKLNNEPLAKKEAQSLDDGDVLSFAGYRLLLGIVENVVVDDSIELVLERTFDRQTDISSSEPILADQEIEELPVEPDNGFSQSEVDLDSDLLFDPFAEGPTILESDESQVAMNNRADMDMDVEFGDEPQVTKMAQHMGANSLQDIYARAGMRRENVIEAMERALEKFLNELDPSELQADYDEYIPMLASRKKRYWTIHRRQFGKKRANGEFRRTFMSLFAEEMRKL
ncbi:FHA domain-containing protein [Planktotalea sp.]|uniref:FHA domain-containing protein n=1 Tax=Planktotalea sp. TaxID=2029877 RepID=UPI0025D2A111|nr:FHA domain-containing protein [Planktotalea sp.]